MPLSREVQFVRQRAQRLREMAEQHHTPLTSQLQMMAAELDALADEMERRRDIQVVEDC
jgi:hypothetical protein